MEMSWRCHGDVMEIHGYTKRYPRTSQKISLNIRKRSLKISELTDILGDTRISSGIVLGRTPSSELDVWNKSIRRLSDHGAYMLSIRTE